METLERVSLKNLPKKPGELWVLEGEWELLGRRLTPLEEDSSQSTGNKSIFYDSLVHFWLQIVTRHLWFMFHIIYLITWIL